MGGLRDRPALVLPWLGSAQLGSGLAPPRNGSIAELRIICGMVQLDFMARSDSERELGEEGEALGGVREASAYFPTRDMI